MSDPGMDAPEVTARGLIQASAVARFSPAERIGLLAGDQILAFGPYSSQEVLADQELIRALKRTDKLLVLRGSVVFRLGVGEGVEGCQFEAAGDPATVTARPGEWPAYWGGVQSSGDMILIPSTISPLWALAPPLLYVRFRLWQMVAATFLVLGIGFVAGDVPLLLAYGVSALVPAFGGAGLLRDAAQKQGYAPRGAYELARARDAGALEIVTAGLVRAKLAAPGG